MLIYCAVLIPLILYCVAIAALTVAMFRKGVYENLYNHYGNYTNDNLPNISIIIPFRNEEENLPALMDSLEKQNYRGMIEIVFVNDGSEDNGVDVIKKYPQVKGNISIKIIDLPISYDITLTSKQQALELGVARSSHPLLLFTDADMVLSPEWAEGLVRACSASGASLVFGHTSISRSGKKLNLFNLFEAWQLEFLFAFAYAFSKLNLTGSCMGNNLLIVKDAYIKCGGQRGAGYSVAEDRALLELLRGRGFKTAAAEPFSVTALTYPSRAKKQLFDQAARWVCGGLRPNSGLFWAGLLLLIQNFAVLAVLITAIWGTVSLLTDYDTIPQSPLLMFMLDITSTPTYLPPLATAALAVINFLLTWAFLALAFGKIRSPAPRLLYPVYYLFMMAETIILAFSLAFGRKFEWKGRDLFGRGGGAGKNKSYINTGIPDETAGGLK